jgi:hypothetical protein
MAKYWRGQRITYGTGRFRRMWVGVAIGALVVIGALVGWAAFGTLQAPTEEGITQNIEQLRTEQSLANTIFEVIPGQVEKQPQHATPIWPDGGTRYWIVVRVRSLDTVRTLQAPYWNVTATGFDAAGEELRTTVSIPSGGWTILPGEYSDRYVNVTGERGLTSFALSVSYDEPGRTGSSASFVYPFRR